MPIYEYQCKNCDHCFERLVFAADEAAGVKCPKCDSPRVDKLMSCANALGGERSPFCSPGAGGFS